MVTEINSEGNGKEFAQSFYDFTKNTEILIDDFYSNQPLLHNLYKYVMINLVNLAREKFNLFWNENYLKLKLQEILDMIEVFVNFNKVLQKYKIVDVQIGKYGEKMIHTYLSYYVSQCNEFLNNALYEFKTNFYEDGD